MSVVFARPDVSELVFHVYNRTVHPELFRIVKQNEIHLHHLRATVRICEAGHVICVEHGNDFVTEVSATAAHSLPRTKRCLARRLRGQRDASFELASGLKYHMSFHVERLDPDVFLNFHEELSLDCDKANVAHRFPSSSRLSPSALSLVQTDITASSLLVHTFHTFPENCAVVKTQSLFER